MKKITLLLLTFTFFMAACKRNSSVTSLPDIYHYLTESQIQKTPYFTNPDFDTLTFLSNTNDTLIFAKIKTDTSYYKTYDRWCFDCPTQTNYHQTLRNTYQTIKGNGKFQVKHAKLSESGYNDNILITFNNEIYHINDNWFSKSFGYKYSLPFVDVNSTIYNNVIYVFSKLGDTTTNRMYLTIEDGCFYVKNKQSNDFWFLKN